MTKNKKKSSTAVKIARKSKLSGTLSIEKQKELQDEIALLRKKIQVLETQNKQSHISSEQFYEELNLICDVSPLARRSLGCQFDINHNYGLNTIGTCFPFLNRTESSVAIVNVFKEQDRVRKRAIKALKSGNASTWETFKRAIKFPLCMGLSGCGKSTAARKAVPVYLETVKERTAFDENLATAAKKCNYQLAMDSLSEDPVLSIVHKIIIELLNEASKYSADAVDDPLLHKKRIEQLVIKYSSVVDLSSIYKWLLEKTGASCMIINIDETQALEESQLPKVLRALGEILCSGKALYYSVTGLYANRIIKGITDSFSEGISLILPVLTVKHGVEICQSVGLLPESGDVNPFFRHLLWIAGGIPRNLDYLIYSVAEVVGVLHSDGLYYHASSMMSMQEYVQNLNHKRFNFIMDKWVSYCDIGFKKSMIWNDSQIMDSVVSLCIAGYPIRNTSCVLRDSNPIYTIENAQEDQILQLDSTSGAAVVPPIQLRSMYKKGTGSKCVDVQLLANDLNGIMSSRDNETLYMAVLLRRIRAKRVLGFKTMPLSEVLGVVPPSSFDFSIDISGPGTYNFVRQKSGGVAPPVGRNSGSISPPTESFADGYLRLTKNDASESDVKIYLQEKQSTVARNKSYNDSSKIPRTIHEGDVEVELRKVPRDGLLVYISDCEIAANEIIRLNDVLVITGKMRMQAFGDVIGQLKTFCLSSSFCDVSSSDN